MKLKELDGVEAWKGGAILPVGDHKVRIDSAEPGQTSNQNPQIELEFIAENGAGSIRNWLTYTDNSAGKLKSLLDATGVKLSEAQQDMEVEDLIPDIARAVIGRRLTIHVGTEPDYKDPTRTRPVVTGFYAAESDVPSNGDDIPF